MQFDESVILQHHFKTLVIRSSEYLTQKRIEDFLIEAEKTICRIFDIEDCRLYFKDPETNTMFRFDHETKEKKEFASNVGIIGICMKKNVELNIPDGYNNVNFNSLVDIDTTRPLHLRPIRDPQDQKRVIGVFQMINKKGTVNQCKNNKHSRSVTIDMITCEILDPFIKSLQIGMIRQMEFDEKSQH